MKNKIIMLLLTMFTSTAALAQTFSETLKKEFTFEKSNPDNMVMIANLNGSVMVSGYDGTAIMVEVKKTITAKTAERLERGKKEVQLGMLNEVDTLIFFTDGLCAGFGRGNNGCNNSNRRDWGYGGCHCNNRNCHNDYEFTMDFTIKIPRGLNVNVSTINDGSVTVANMRGSVVANNVNGGIRLSNLVRESIAHTINGDVDIEYVGNPPADCSFYSLNGDINAWFQKGLAANLSFDSFNGHFYTNIDHITALPASMSRVEEKEGIKFKVTGNRYKVGIGGVLLDFETFNGDVYLKEKTN